MSENAKKSRKVKDLDPKGRAENVKGGIFCLVGVAARTAYRAAERAKDTVRTTLNPR